MIKQIPSFYSAFQLWLLKRNQFYSTKLRVTYREKFGIDIGLYTYGCFDRWRMPGPLRVGRYCSVASTARSTNNNHPLSALTTSPVLYHRYFGAVDSDATWDGYLVIEDDVWIGHNVVILPGCRRIGRGAVVGAGSIVTRDIAPYSIVAGNPARKLRDRFSPDLVEALEASRWWELDVPALRSLIRTDPDVASSPSVENLRKYFREDGRFGHVPDRA